MASDGGDGDEHHWLRNFCHWGDRLGSQLNLSIQSTMIRGVLTDLFVAMLLSPRRALDDRPVLRSYTRWTMVASGKVLCS